MRAPYNLKSCNTLESSPDHLLLFSLKTYLENILGFSNELFYLEMAYLLNW